MEKYITNIKKIIDSDNFKIRSTENFNIYKNLFLLYNNNIPEIDYSSKTTVIEFKTINYENLNYEKVLTDLIELEETFFHIINNLPVFRNLIEIFGNIIYHNIGSIQNTVLIFDIYNIMYYIINEDYTGSYHVWVTCPYNSDTSMKKFLLTHSTLANKLQLLEPILNAHYSSPSYNVINNNKNSKSSLRQFINKYGNYGTSDISLLNGSKKHYINNYYLSENDILNNEYKINNNYLQKDYIYDYKENIIINYDSLESRSITSNIYKPFNIGNEESKYVFLKNYFSIVFEKTKIRPKAINNSSYNLSLGSDIRTRSMNNFVYPLHKDYKKKLLLKNNKLIEVYHNIVTNEISYKRVFDKNEYNGLLNNRVGIEFRILDHFPTKYLNQFLSLLVPIVLDSDKNSKKIKFVDSHIAKQYWHDEMADAIMKGYNYTISAPYIHALEKEFNINIVSKKKLNTEMIMQILNNLLHAKHKKTHKNSLYTKMKFKSKIIFENFNKKAWFEIIDKYFNNNPEKLKQILYIESSKRTNINCNKNILEILGKKNNYDISEIKNYIDSFNYIK